MSHIISFLGGDSQVGTSMISQSVAETLYRQKHKVLLISGSGKYGNDFLDCGPEKSIDRVRANILSGRLRGRELEQVSGREQDFNLIGGTMHPLHCSDFPEDTFQVLLAETEGMFEYIVIDGGDGTDMNLTRSALRIGKTIYFVITQQPKSVKRFELLKEHNAKDLEGKSQLLLNKYMKDPSLMTWKEVEKLCGQRIVATVPYMEYGWQAEMEKRTLMGRRKYAKQIRVLVKQINDAAEQEGTWKRK